MSKEMILPGMENNKIFDHDCESCIYLGTLEHEGEYIDHYLGGFPCNMGHPTMIARHGSDGWEYNSYPLYINFMTDKLIKFLMEDKP